MFRSKEEIGIGIGILRPAHQLILPSVWAWALPEQTLRMEHLPNLNAKYWSALILASIFGANAGDFFSDVLGLGHFLGLPILALAFAGVLIAERFDRYKHHAYFWAAIIVVRSAATNIGDIGHDLHLHPISVMAFLSALLLATLTCWAVFRKQVTVPCAVSSSLASAPQYWWTMLVAGALGTVVGDYFSYAMHLGNLEAALLLGAVVVVLFLLLGPTDRLSRLFYYWLTVVFIRSAGTAMGDFFAHKLLGLPLSTLTSGLAFIALLVLWRDPGYGSGDLVRLAPVSED